MRRHISKSIVRRSAALRTSLDKYNKLAPLQNPPRPTIDYAEITSCAWLGDFDLLRHSRHEILVKPWSSRSNRAVANKWYKVVGARYEILRLNIEIKRLAAWVNAEDQSLADAATTLAATQPLLAAEFLQISKKQRRINDTHRVRLNKIYSLDGYTGAVPVECATPAPNPSFLDTDEVDMAGIGLYEDDALDEAATVLEDTMVNLQV